MKKILKENYIYFIIIAIILFLYYYLFNSIIYEYIDILDNNIRNSVLTSNTLNIIMKIFTFMGDIYIPLVIFTLLLIFNKKNNKHTLYLLIMYIFSGILVYLNKFIINRARPVSALINIPKSSSFPSAHAFTSMCFYVSLVIILTKDIKGYKKNILIILSILLSLTIGYSRIYLGVHYFSDVVCGFVLSIPCLIMFNNIYKRSVL